MRRRAIATVALAALLGGPTGCEPDRDMAPSADLPDTTTVHKALREPAARDALLDTMPGGEMARGDSVAETDLLEDKMP